MSYTKQFNTTVHYSGSARTYVPAREKGRWENVHYEGDVPVQINVTVNTDPFDESVEGADAALAVVAGALTATEAAQVAQIEQSAKDISQTAINGFYRVLSSELSAQASESGSGVRSTAGLIARQGEQIARIHEQMDGDFHAIKARYLRIFAELDRELERRVKELDQAVFQISGEVRNGVISGPYVQSAARTSVYAWDTNATSLKLLCARAKARVSDSLKRLGHMCGFIADYANTTQSIMLPKTDETFLFMPVVYTVQTDIANSSPRIVVHESAGLREGSAKRQVIAMVAKTDASSWRQLSQHDQAAVDRCFLQSVEDYAAGARNEEESAYRNRVSAHMMSMYRQSQVTTTYRDR